jgi:pimeloyl-ACP methyl ester carboxylesterase
MVCCIMLPNMEKEHVMSLNLELITRTPTGPPHPTPILFVHGMWHGAWCWDEYFLPYFAAQGFTAHALSFRNHGQSASAGSIRWRRAAEYVADVAQVVRQIGQTPVLVGHSLGGYVVQKYLEGRAAPAAVLMASVPPAGTARAAIRTLRRAPLAFLRVNLELHVGPLVGTPRLARETLFSPDLPPARLRSYFPRLQDESYRAFLDIMLLNLPRPGRVPRLPMLVVGGTNDAIFTPAEFRATARAYGADLEIFPGIAHSMMLETRWQAVADRIIAWLQGVPGLTRPA